MHQKVEATQELVGPWWLVVALVEMQFRDVVEPVLRDLQARLMPVGGARVARVEFDPMVRTGTRGRLALRWGFGGATSFPTMSGELLLDEVDENCTALTLAGRFARPVEQQMFDDFTERLARRIEAAVGEEIGTRPAR